MKRRPYTLLPAIILLMTIAIASHATAYADIESGTLNTPDNISIAYTRFTCGSDAVIIICPGFYNSKENQWMQKTSDILCPPYDTIVMDFRGHGKSGGRFTWTSREHLDLEAVLDYAKSLGYKRIGIVGYSLGAATAVNVAAGRDDIDSMVLISCPSKIGLIDFHFWEFGMVEDFMDNMRSGWKGKGARSGSMFLKKNDPIDMIPLTKKTPILFINGDHDWVINDYHSRRLYNAAIGEKRLEVLSGGLHAEQLIEHKAAEIKGLLLEWFSNTLR